MIFAPRDWRRQVVRGIMYGLAALLILHVCTCCASLQPIPTPLAYTFCAEDSTGVRPYSYIRLDVLPSEELRQIMTHEVAHDLTMRGFPSCAAYEKWARKNEARVEAIAWCASAMAWSSQEGVPLPQAIDRFARWFSGSYPSLHLTEAQARSLIVEYCHG